MKVKLLKKIRKRYSMIHYPDGVYMFDDFQKGPLTILKDNRNDWRFKSSFMPKEKAYNYLHGFLMYWIEKDYGPFKSKRKQYPSEVLWYGKK